MSYNYKCEIDGCSWEGAIRTKIKNKESEYYGKKCCPFHAAQYNGYSFFTKKYSTIKYKPKKHKRENTELEEYYLYHVFQIENGKRSEESGQYLEPSRVHVCHIFPKRKYKSIQANLLNAVYLTWQEHSDFDRLLDQFDFEKLEKEFPVAWPKVCVRVKELLPSIKENGRLKTEFETYTLNRTVSSET